MLLLLILLACFSQPTCTTDIAIKVHTYGITDCPSSAYFLEQGQDSTIICRCYDR